VTLDPVSFALDALASRGALVDHTAEGGLAVLPPALARTLGTAEELVLASGVASAGVTACGFGSPLLDRLIADTRADVPVSWVEIDARPPALSQAQTIAGRIVLRNGLLDVMDATVGDEVYVSAFFSVVAEADDRYEGHVQVVIRPAGAGTPDDALAALLDPARTTHRMVPGSAWDLADLAPLVARARASAGDLLRPFQDTVGRRLDRDRSRLEDYFASLMADARTPRRAVSEASISAKLAHLAAEREQKLRDLGPRYTIKATVAPAAILCARVPAARVRLRVRRRKAEAELVVVVPADVRSPDRLACAACHRTTWRPAACDDQLHLLCEVCAPSAQGRPRCNACSCKR
jgi:hypothetical protein